MNKKILMLIIFFLSIYLANYAVQEYNDEFPLAPESAINPFWEIVVPWDNPPFYMDYNGYGQYIVSIESQIEWQNCGFKYKIGKGDFDINCKIANADFYEGDGIQQFTMNIWDAKPDLWGQPHWGLWVEMVRNNNSDKITVLYRNGTESKETGFKQVIYETINIKFQFPISLRITWEENLKAYSFFYGMEGKYPDILLATTLDYTKESSPERWGSLIIQQQIPCSKTTTFYLDSFRISSKPITEIPQDSISLKEIISGSWNFENKDLKADIGKDLELMGPTVKDKVRFGSTTDFGISNIDGKPANVLKFDAFTNKEAIAVYPEADANGGGKKINQYSIIMDIMFEKSKTNWWSILQTDQYNSPGNWGEIYFSNGGTLEKGGVRFYGLGTGGAYYDPKEPISKEKWYRVAFIVDLTGPYIYNYINGDFIGQQGARERIGGIDGALALSPKNEAKPFLLFTENEFNDPLNVNTGSGYLASLQIRPYKMDAGEIAAIGRPTADGIPVDKNIQRFNSIDDEVEYGKFNTTIVWNDYFKGIEKIKSDGKLGLIMFTHDDIISCKKVDRYLEESKIRNYTSSFELIKVPAKKERDLSIQYGVYRVPTLILVNSQNKVLKRWVPKTDEVTEDNLLNFFRNL